MTSPERKTNDDNAADSPEWDRSALSSLVREVQATHFFVWTMDTGGVLTSAKIPVTEIAQQIRMASRILESNFDEAMRMIQSASRQFDNAAHRWDSQARQSEGQLRTAAAPGKLNEAKARHNVIRPRIVPVQSLFRRASQSLNEINRRRAQQAADASTIDPGPEDEVKEE